MNSASARIPEALDNIADRLGVPVSSSFIPDASAVAHVAELVRDPAGRQLAAAFVTLPPTSRLALVNVAQSLVPTGSSEIPHAGEER